MALFPRCNNPVPVVGRHGVTLVGCHSCIQCRVAAQSNQAVADKYTAMSKYTAELGAQTQLTTANIQAMATKYVSDNNLKGTKYAADSSAAASKVAAAIHAEAQKYGYDVNAMTQKDIAAFNAGVNKELQQAGFKHEFDIKEAFPNNAWNAFGGLGTQAVEDIQNANLPWGKSIFDYFANVLPGAASGKDASSKKR